MTKRISVSLFFAVIAFVFVAHAQTPLRLNAAGASFPYPIYSKWFNKYKTVSRGVEINYQAIGSGGGIRQLVNKTVDFAASDAPMTDAEMAKSKIPIIHLPTVMGAVAISYNLPNYKYDLKLTGEVVAKIYLGEITKWNDPAIQKLNSHKLPDTYIFVAHRSDGSGTTYVFSDYLAKVNQTWKTKVGYGKSLQWPVGLGGKGNQGVSGLIKQNPGGVGYVELAYANTNHLPTALIKNAHGEFVKASVKSVTLAAAGALKTMPADFRVSLTNSLGRNAYPISSFTYFLVYKTMPAKKGSALIKFLHWAYSKGESMAPALDYAPLPKKLIAKIMKRIKEIRFK